MTEEQDAREKRKAQPRIIAKPGKGPKGVTPEMLAMAEALAHPEGDPYDNARRMGFYCEQCG